MLYKQYDKNHMTDKGRSLGLGGDSRPRGHEFDSSFWILDKKNSTTFEETESVPLLGEDSIKFCCKIYEL